MSGTSSYNLTVKYTRYAVSRQIFLYILIIIVIIYFETSHVNFKLHPPNKFMKIIPILFHVGSRRTCFVLVGLFSLFEIVLLVTRFCRSADFFMVPKIPIPVIHIYLVCFYLPGNTEDMCIKKCHYNVLLHLINWDGVILHKS